MTTLPRNRNDKENARFGLTSDDKVGVRVLGATKAADGTELGSVILEQMTLMLSKLDQINNNMEVLVGQMRYMTEININEEDKY
jgi:hypothetical protein